MDYYDPERSIAAVAAVTFEPYQGYALWGWIHEQVNVPATYGELAE